MTGEELSLPAETVSAIDLRPGMLLAVVDGIDFTPPMTIEDVRQENGGYLLRLTVWGAESMHELTIQYTLDGGWPEVEVHQVTPGVD